MKLLWICILLWIGIPYMQAQVEIDNDTLPQSPWHEENPTELMLSNTQSFGEFLIDMTLLNLQVPPSLTSYKLELPKPEKNYNELFKLNPNAVYTQSIISTFTSGLSSWGSCPWSLGWRSHPSTMQMSTFRLKNGMRIHTYGEYNKEGRKVNNPSALPWERNNFKGAFELKSANGNFGFRIEVQQGR